MIYRVVIPAKAGIQFFFVIFSDLGFPISPDALRDRDVSGMTCFPMQFTSCSTQVENDIS